MCLSQVICTVKSQKMLYGQYSAYRSGYSFEPPYSPRSQFQWKSCMGSLLIVSAWLAIQCIHDARDYGVRVYTFDYIICILCQTFPLSPVRSLNFSLAYTHWILNNSCDSCKFCLWWGMWFNSLALENSHDTKNWVISNIYVYYTSVLNPSYLYWHICLILPTFSEYRT